MPGYWLWLPFAGAYQQRLIEADRCGGTHRAACSVAPLCPLEACAAVLGICLGCCLYCRRAISELVQRSRLIQQPSALFDLSRIPGVSRKCALAGRGGTLVGRGTAHGFGASAMRPALHGICAEIDTMAVLTFQQCERTAAKTTEGAVRTLGTAQKPPFQGNQN